MLMMCGRFPNFDQARTDLDDVLKSGKALDVFRQMVKAQGGDPLIVRNRKNFFPWHLSG